MPTYEYQCARCGDFDALRSVAQRNEACACPYCGAYAPRVMNTAPTLSTMTTATRKAHVANERARHEPKQSSQLAREHGAGCSCCSVSATNTKTVKMPDGAKTFPSKRPWMISH